jgi:hypothetical protein
LSEYALRTEFAVPLHGATVFCTEKDVGHRLQIISDCVG